MLLDPDLMQWKLVGPKGVTFFYASQQHMALAVAEGGLAYTRMACYVIGSDGLFVKNRSAGDLLPNLLLKMGRTKVNEFFDFMEKQI